MLGLISQEIIKLIPYAIALIGLCFLVLIACLITRKITIKHMRRFWPEIQSGELRALARENEALKDENRVIRAENDNWYVKVKTAKAAMDGIVI